jgi:hypothetical protein
MGMPLQELRTRARLVPKGNDEYEVRSLPGGYPGFNAYRLLVAPLFGLCRITAWSPAVHTGPRGEEIRARFEQLREALTGRYGAGRRFDLLRTESPWRDGDEWLLALQHRDRSLYAVWTDEYSDLDGAVSRVSLRVDPAGNGKARLQVVYEFKNTVRCTESLKERQARKL